jgi:hypothetical protein
MPRGRSGSLTSRSGELKDACPAGTIPNAGSCIETTERADIDWYEASATCHTAGRRLPTASELIAFRAQPGALVNNMASELYNNGTSTLYWTVGEGATSGHLTTVAYPFRCVAPMTNA